MFFTDDVSLMKMIDVVNYSLHKFNILKLLLAGVPGSD